MVPVPIDVDELIARNTPWNVYCELLKTCVICDQVSLRTSWARPGNPTYWITLLQSPDGLYRIYRAWDYTKHGVRTFDAIESKHATTSNGSYAAAEYNRLVQEKLGNTTRAQYVLDERQRAPKGNPAAAYTLDFPAEPQKTAPKSREKPAAQEEKLPALARRGKLDWW